MSNQLSNGLLARRRRINENPPLPDPTFTYAGRDFDSGTRTVFNVSLTGLGVDYANRYVIFCISSGNGSVGPTSVTIDDQPAALVSEVFLVNIASRMYIAKVPSGASVSAAVTYGSSTISLTSAWGVLTDLESMVPVSEGTASGTNTTTVNVSVPSKGVVVAHWWTQYGVSPNATNWSSPMITAMNQNYGTQQRHSMAYRIAAADVASYDVKNTFNYSTTTLNVAVFR